MMTRRSIAALWLSPVLVCAALCGCAKPPQPNVEPPPLTEQSSEAPSPPPQPQTITPSSPPKLEQVQEAVNRIFKDAVVIDLSRKPSFLVGDFNGDGSQDLAVILKPAAGKLQELNQEFPNWIAREPLKELLIRRSAALDPRAKNSLPSPAAGQTVRFEQTDVLLAIIHGEGVKGWRDPQATQTHLLRGIVGSDLRKLSAKEALKAYKGRKPLPPIYGDVIQQSLIGQSGFLHFAGSIYGWYDPKNYKPQPTSMPGHSAMSRMR
jgi:hypothetical protein